MKTLQEFRQIVIENFERSMTVPQLAAMHDILAHTLLRTPIIDFDSGYKAFIKQIADSASHYDAWVLTVFDIASEVGDFSGVVDEINKIIVDLKKTMPGGTAFETDVTKEDRSFVCCFVYRITIAMVSLPEKKEGE